MVNALSDWNSGLQEVLGLEPVIIPTIFFWAKNILLLSEGFLQKTIPLFITKWK